MNWYIYKVSRSSHECKTNELRALLAPIKVNKIEINEKNPIGVRLQGEKTETVNYLGKILGGSVHTRSELEEKLLEYIKKYGAGCYYEFNDEKYLLLSKPEEKNGVWHEGDLIFHQISPFPTYRENEVVPLGKIQPEEEDAPIHVGFNNEYYFDKWMSNLTFCLFHGTHLSVALLLSFAQTYNEWLYNDHYPAPYICKNTIDTMRNGTAYYRTIDGASAQVANYYFPMGWQASFKGDVPPSPVAFYSSQSSSQLTYAFYCYIYEFWAYATKYYNGEK